MIDDLTKALAEALKLPKNTTEVVIRLSCDSLPTVHVTTTQLPTKDSLELVDKVTKMNLELVETAVRERLILAEEENLQLCAKIVALEKQVQDMREAIVIAINRGDLFESDTNTLEDAIGAGGQR